MLQNDMGNTLIQDSTTGNIMGLSEGFIPVGMREHGGVLYIASFNPSTKQSELGSIPSPLFSYAQDGEDKGDSTLDYLCMKGDTLEVDSLGINLLTDKTYTFNVGDGCSCGLYIPNGNIILQRDINGNLTDFPILSTRNERGLISLQVFAESSDGSCEINLNEHLYTPGSENDNWYDLLQGEGKSGLVLSRLQSGEAIQYPNFKSGIVKLKAFREGISNIEVVENITTGRKEPSYFQIEGITITVYFDVNSLYAYTDPYGKVHSGRSSETLTIKATGVYGYDSDEEVVYTLSHGQTCSLFGIGTLNVTYTVQIADSENKLFIDEKRISCNTGFEAKYSIDYDCSAAVYVEVSNSRKGSNSGNDNLGSEESGEGGYTPPED